MDEYKDFLFDLKRDIIIIMKNIYKILKEINIDYKKYDHKAVMNVAEADEVYNKLDIDFQRCKNLFLRNAKGKKHFLFVTDAHKQVNLKELGEFLGERLSFASPERLEKYLKTQRGSVSLLNLINDENNEVVLILDREVAEAEKAGFHPDSNEATLILGKESIQKFIEYSQNKVVSYIR